MGERKRSEENISVMFNKIARTYDLLNDLLSFGMQRRWKKLAVAELGIGPGDRLLDICTGTADIAILEAERLREGGLVTALDFSHEMTVIGRHKVRERQLEGKVNFVQGNAEKLPFEEGAFDGASVGFGLRNIEDRERALTEVRRVLKSGKRFVCLEFSQPESGIIAFFYGLYARFLVPLLGRLISGDRDAYAYLPESIAAFYSKEKLKAAMESAGFRAVYYRKLMFGVIAIHVGEK